MNEEIPGGGTPPTSGETPKDTPQEPKTPDTPKDPQDFDYGAELSRVQGGSKYSPLEKAMHSAKKIAEEIKKHGGDPASVFQSGESHEGEQKSDQGQGDKPPKWDDIDKRIDERMARERSALFDPILDSKIAPITRSPEEAKLVKHWTNKLLPEVDGNVDQAVEIAWFISNRHRFKETFAEIVRGKTSETMKADGQGGAGQKKATPKSEPTGKEADFAKSKGLVWDEGSGKFVSPARKAHEAKQRK